MGHRRRAKKQSISLFPFLSILACVIGTLTLMITALALAQMSTDKIADVERLEFAKRDAQRAKDEIERLENLLKVARSKAGALNTEIADLEAEVKRLLAEEKRLKNGPRPVTDTELSAEKQRLDAALMEEIKKLEKEYQSKIDALKADLKKMQEEIAKLKKKLEALGKPPDPAEVRVLPSGSGLNAIPTFVECRNNGIVVYGDEQPHRVSRGTLNSDEKWLALLDEIAAYNDNLKDDKVKKRRIIFLVRSDGFATCSTASAIAYRHRADNGKMPVVGQGKLDLSVFK